MRNRWSRGGCSSPSHVQAVSLANLVIRTAMNSGISEMSAIHICVNATGLLRIKISFFLCIIASKNGQCLVIFALRRPVYRLRRSPDSGTLIPRLAFIVFNAEMTNMSYLAIFMRADHISFRGSRLPGDYLVPEKYRFRRLSPGNLPRRAARRLILNYFPDQN